MKKGNDVEAKVERRAAEIALNHGRAATEKTRRDVVRAKRELKPLKVTSPKTPRHD